MRPLGFALALAALGAASLAARADDSTFVFTTSSHANSVLDTDDNSDVAITFTATGDTSTLTYSSSLSGYVESLDSVTVTDGSITDTVTGPLYLFIDGLGKVNIELSGIPLIGTYSSSFASYTGTTSISGSGTALYSGGVSFTTGNGQFTLDNEVGLSDTLTATVVPATPEPASLTLLGTGLAAALALARRRLPHP